MGEILPKHEILLLDDDEDDYLLLKALLKDAYGDSVKLDWYQSDGLATEMICSGIYRITMVDYTLGNDNGLLVIERTMVECPEQVFFLFTAWVKNNIVEEAVRVGAKGVLRKQEISIELIREMFLPYLE